MTTRLKTRDWWGKTYASKSDLFEAGKAGIVEMNKESGEFGSWYTFSKSGKQIAKFYQDHTFGFCTQPYGVMLNI